MPLDLDWFVFLHKVVRKFPVFGSSPLGVEGFDGARSFHDSSPDLSTVDRSVAIPSHRGIFVAESLHSVKKCLLGEFCGWKEQGPRRHAILDKREFHPGCG